MEKSLRILIVDDEKSNLRLLEIVLEREGHHVVLASNGEEALQKARDEKPDLAISDILMPVMDGYALCREWHRDPVLSLIPFVFYTATYQDKEDEDLALALGAARFLRKPIEPISFLSQIDQVIQETKAGRIRPVASTLADETEHLKLFNGRLVQKLEMKNMDLARSEERYRLLFEANQDGLALSEADTGIILDVNPALCDLVGRMKDLLLRSHFSILHPPDELPRYQRLFEDAAKGQKRLLVRGLEVQRPDGMRVPVEISASRLGLQGVPVVLSIFRDVHETRKAEEALQRLRDEQKTIFDSIPACIWYKDCDNRYVRVNRATCTLMGLEPEQIEGHSAEEIFPEFAQKYYEDDLEVIRSGEPKLGIVEQASAASGKLRWVRTDKIPFKGPDGTILGVIAFSLDITEHRKVDVLREAIYNIASAGRASKNLGELLEALHLIIQGIMAARNFYIALYDEQGGLIHFPYYADEKDAPPSPMPVGLGLTAYVLKTRKSLLADAARLDTLKREGRVVQTGSPAAVWLGVPLILEERVIGVLVVQHYSDPMAFGESDQQLLEFVASEIARAIERKRGEEALRSSEKRFHDLVENLGEGIGIVDPSENFIFGNPAQERIFGIEPGELVGRNLAEFATAEDFAHFRNNTGLRAKGVRSTYETTIRRADGQIRDVFVTGTPYLDEMGAFKGTFTICLDITERKRLEVELVAAKKLEAIGMITGGVAHEIRNPLNAIQIMAAVLEKKQGDDPDVRQSVAYIKEHVHRLSTLMNDLLVLGRPSSLTEFVLCDLRALAISAARIAEEGVAGSDGRVRVRSDGPLPPVVGDPAKLAQVLINLLQNALSISPEGTPVEVEVSLEGPMAQVQVRDQGPGIAQDFLPRLFQPFQSMRKGGTGLGLAIVQKIVADHGGIVEAANNDPPPGATFTVRIPLAWQGEGRAGVNS